MFKYTNAFTNRSGDSLPGYFARLYDAGGNLVSIYADASETPISTVSGVANAALSDENGMFRWYVANGTYDIRFYDANDVFVSVETGVPMFEASGVYTDLSASTGATLVGSTGSITVQASLDARPTAATLAASGGAALVGNQLPAGSDLAIQPVSDFINNSVLMPSQFAGTPEQRLVRAMTEAGTARPTIGQTVQIPRGIIPVSAPFNLNNRAMIKGVNRRGSVIQADPAHSGPSMVTVINGTTSTFDNRLEELTLDCNEVASLSGVISSAWQEGGGLRDVLIQKFRGYGVDIVQTYGGVSALWMENSEFMGSPSGSLACIRVTDPSAVSSFILQMASLSLVGAGVVAAPGGEPQQAAARAMMPVCIDIVNGSTTSVGVHVEVCERGFRLDGNGDHIIIGAKGSAPNGVNNAGVGTLVEVAATFTGSLRMIGCRRNGSINLLKDLRTGGLGTIQYDTDVWITPDQPVGKGAIVASASIDGSGTPAVTKGFGIASITDNGTGDYTVTLTRSAQNSADFSVFASMNANGWVQCALNGVDSVRVKCFNGSGGAIDVNELKILVVRVA